MDIDFEHRNCRDKAKTGLQEHKMVRVKFPLHILDREETNVN